MSSEKENKKKKPQKEWRPFGGHLSSGGLKKVVHGEGEWWGEHKERERNVSGYEGLELKLRVLFSFKFLLLISKY